MKSNPRNRVLHLAPLAGRGRIASAIRVRGSLRERRGNRFEDTRHVAENVVVPKSQYAMVMVSEPFVSNSVATIARMLTAVDFHDQAAFAAHEVYRVRSDWLLSNEFVSIQPARSQTMPKLPFRIRRRASQAPRTFSPEFVSTAHAETPPHPSRTGRCSASPSARRPLPARGERQREE
jgi:hypothetical protein